MTVVIIDVYQQLWSELVSLTGDFWNVLIYLPIFNFFYARSSFFSYISLILLNYVSLIDSAGHFSAL